MEKGLALVAVLSILFIDVARHAPAAYAPRRRFATGQMSPWNMATVCSAVRDLR